MRRTQLMLFALVMLNFGCEPADEARPVPVTGLDYQWVSDGFHDMFQGGIGLTESLELVSVIDRTEKELTVQIEAVAISEATKNHFSGYFEGTELLDQKIFYSAPPFSSRFGDGNAIKILEHLIDTAMVFNEVQKMYIKSFSRNIEGVKNYAEGFEVIESFKNKVLNSGGLSEDDKVILLEMAIGSKALLEFLENDGLQRVQKKISAELGYVFPSGRTAGCSVEWRSVWMDGVVGLTFGAVTGALGGAIAGSFTIPILGTVSGGINGAVYGGAFGFTMGVIQGVASDLMTTCFRPGSSQVKQIYSSCDKAWEAYMNNYVSTLPSDCFMLTIPIKELI